MYDVEKEIIRTPVLLLRLVRLVVVVVGYECIMNVLAWFSPLGHPAPQGRTGAPTRHGLGTRTPSSDTHTPSSTTHARQVRTQVRYRFATQVRYRHALCRICPCPFTYTSWLGQATGLCERDARDRRSTGCAIGSGLMCDPLVTSGCDAWM